MADCTYKTNRYKMPLMHFIGLSNVSKSFSVAFCFLKSETKEDYRWALHAFSNCFGMHPEVFVTDQEDALINAASEVFPSTSHFLCIWHLNKNILKNCRHFFSTADEYNIFFDDWKNTMYSLLEQDFEANYQHFKYTWAAFPKPLVGIYTLLEESLL
jgi:hypothetical protein